MRDNNFEKSFLARFNAGCISAAAKNMRAIAKCAVQMLKVANGIATRLENNQPVKLESFNNICRELDNNASTFRGWLEQSQNCEALLSSMQHEPEVKPEAKADEDNADALRKKIIAWLDNFNFNGELEK